MKPKHTAIEHTCCGTEINEIASLQMRDFVKNNYDEGNIFILIYLKQNS